MKRQEFNTLSGPSYGPLSGEKPRSLVVFFHGYGASGDDLIALAYSWAALLPHTLFISPDAPFKCEQNSLGRQWFSLKDWNAERLGKEMDQLSPLLHNFFHDLLETYHLQASQLALVGFSQGTLLALNHGIYHYPVAGILGYSGAFLPQEHAYHPVPVSLIHGVDDTVLTLKNFHLSKDALKKLNIPLETYICENLGHGINPLGQEKGGQFLQRLLSP